MRKVNNSDQKEGGGWLGIYAYSKRPCSECNGNLLNPYEIDSSLSLLENKCQNGKSKNISNRNSQQIVFKMWLYYHLHIGSYF